MNLATDKWAAFALEFASVVKESKGELSANRTEHGWVISGGTKEQQEKFKDIASRAAAQLGFHGTADQGMEYWLNRLNGLQKRKQ